jgi:hypothetical protein
MSTPPAPPLPPISRPEVLARAWSWVDRQVHYLTADGGHPEQALDPDGLAYRTDCSGYVAMAWRAGIQPSTADFDVLGDQISPTDLLPGDALLWKGLGGYGPDGGHVLLFGGWADTAGRSYLAYELAGGRRAQLCALRYPYRDGSDRYVPWRYRGITG